MATAVTNQDVGQLHAAAIPPRLRHQRLRDALRALPPLHDVAAVRGALRELFEHGWLDLPGLGSKDTRFRFRCFVEVGAHDLSLARLVESHADAIAVLSEAGREPEPGALYGMWAGRSPQQPLRAECSSKGWLLHGEVTCCPGTSAVDRALIVARLPEPMVFDVPRSALAGVEIEAYPAVGLAQSDQADLLLQGCTLPVEALIGPPGFFTARRGYWAAALGVSACWLGGAVGVYGAWQGEQQQQRDPHGQAHFGAAFASLSAAGQVLHDAAHAIDGGEGTIALQRRALWTRHVVESSCRDVLERANRALGESPVMREAAQIRRMADLPAYLRQGNAERDLALLGEQVAKLSEVNWL